MDEMSAGADEDAVKSLLARLYSGAGQSDAEFYASDQFRMYCYKVIPCSKREGHDWTECPFCHPGEKATRRDPTKFSYAAVACPDMKKTGECPRGDACLFAHNVFEYWMHPTRYRTQMCSYGPACKRGVCFFAHQFSDLRVVEQPDSVQQQIERELEAIGLGSGSRPGSQHGGVWGTKPKASSSPALESMHMARMRILQQELMSLQEGNGGYQNAAQLLQQAKLQAAVQAMRSQAGQPAGFMGYANQPRASPLLGGAASLPSDALMNMDFLQHGLGSPNSSFAAALAAQHHQQQHHHHHQQQQQQQQQLAATLQLLNSQSLQQSLSLGRMGGQPGPAAAPPAAPGMSGLTCRMVPPSGMPPVSSAAMSLPPSPFAASPLAGLNAINGASLSATATPTSAPVPGIGCNTAPGELDNSPFSSDATKNRLLAMLPQLLQQLQVADPPLQASLSSPAAMHLPTSAAAGLKAHMAGGSPHGPLDALSLQSDRTESHASKPSTRGARTPSDGSHSPSPSIEETAEDDAHDDVLTANGILESLSLMVDGPSTKHFDFGASAGLMRLQQSTPVAFSSIEMQEALRAASLHRQLQQLDLA